ncbi:hypothetical protein GCM10020229_24110 [Kitasatospora albolonga]
MTTYPRGPQGQRPDVWVTEAFPPALQRALAARGGVPVPVHDLVLHQLHQRTPAELRERIERRWYLRFSQLTAAQITERTDEIALDLIAPGTCPDPWCEDGWLLDQHDTARGCPRCRHRTVDTTALPADGAPASAGTVTAAVASIRHSILLARTTSHARQSRAAAQRHNHPR